MSYLYWSLVLLVLGAVGSLLSLRRPRLSLGCAIASICLAGLLTAWTAGRVLVGCEPASQTMSGWAAMPLGSASFQLDGLSAWFLLAASLLAPCAAIYSWGYLHDELTPQAPHGSWRISAYSALLCLLVASLLLVFTAADTVLFLVAWESMSLCGFFLVLHQDRDSDTRRGAWIYLIATHLGTAIFLLPMFALLIAQSHSTRFFGFEIAMRFAPGHLRVIAFVLGVIGFGTKSGLMPMHVWLPHAHPVAPSPVSALLSGIVIKSGIYGLLRLLTWLGPLPVECALALLLLAMVTGIMGILYALAQHQVKRLLAYSSVENIGIIALGIGMGMLGQAANHPTIATLGYCGALLHLLNHTLFKGLLFLSAGTILHGAGTGRIDRLGGLAKAMPANAALFLVAAVSICALPPFNGFVSEWLIYKAFLSGAMAQQSWSWAALMAMAALALIGGLALACFAKVFTVVFLGDARDPHLHPHRTPRAMLWGMAPLAGACLLIGLSGRFLLPLLQRAADPLVPAPAVIDSALAPIGNVSSVLAVLAGTLAILLLARRQLPAQHGSATGRPTWGCGHPYADPRVQYTGSSFAWTLVHCFRHSLRPQVRVTPPAGYFPAGGRLATQTPDAAESRVFQPLFQWIARQFQRLWPLQQGRIQLYLIYIFVVLLLVFVVEAVWAPYAMPPDSQRPRPGLSAVVSYQGGQP